MWYQSINSKINPKSPKTKIVYLKNGETKHVKKGIHREKERKKEWHILGKKNKNLYLSFVAIDYRVEFKAQCPPYSFLCHFFFIFIIFSLSTFTFTFTIQTSFPITNSFVVIKWFKNYTSFGFRTVWCSVNV